MKAVGEKKTSAWSWYSAVARNIAEIATNPLKVIDIAAEIGMSKISDISTQNRLKTLINAYNEKMANEEAPKDKKPGVNIDYDKQVNQEFESIRDFARNAGCPSDVNFERPESNENRFFKAWIEEKYRKGKEAREILKKAKALGLPINLSHLRTSETSWGMSYVRKISKSPYTFMNRNGQMSWNFDILNSSVEMYKQFEKNFEGRLDEIFEQNGLNKDALKLCYTQAQDTVIKDYMKKTYELMCQGKNSAEVKEYLKKGISADICGQVGKCLQMFSNYANKKLDCGEKKTPETKTDTKPKDPDSKDQSAAPKEKTDLFGDLCRCSCNSGVGGGAGFDPAWGCRCSGVIGGKWSAPMASSGVCPISAIKSAGLEQGSTLETVINMNKGWGEKYLKMATDLIEDIWTPLL